MSKLPHKVKYMRYTLLWICLAFCLFTGCQDEFISTENDYYIASFTATQTPIDEITTRATDQGFEPSDEIGIYVVRHRDKNTPEKLQATGNFADNMRYVIDRNGNPQPYSEKDKIILSKSETYDFYAYYPYDPNMSDPTNYIFRIGIDQATKAKYTANDVMFASNLNQNGGVISLAFERKMALAEIHFEKVSDKNISTIILGGIMQTVTLNLADNKAKTEDKNVGNIIMYLYQETENTYIYRALLPAQEVKGDYLFSVIVNSEMIYYKATSTTPLEAGKKSIYLLNLQYRIRAYQRVANTGTVTGAEKEIFNHGESVHLQAIPDYDFNFIGWYESSNSNWEENLVKVTDLPDYYFTATKSALYVAYFEIKKQPIVATAVTLGGYTDGGIVYGSGEGQQGRQYGVRAIATKGFIFKGWYIDGQLVSTESDYNFTVPDHPVFLEARFQKQSITITIDCYPSKEVLAPYYNIPSQMVVDYGKEVKLNGFILSDSPYMFDGYYENGIYLNRDYSYSFTATEDRHIVLRYGLKAFGVSASDGIGILNTPGAFVKSTDDDLIHPTFMQKGQKLRITGYAKCEVYIKECITPVKITNQQLIIKLNDRIMLETNDFEDFFFLAPQSGTYTFHYSMTVEGRLYEGERVGLTLTLYRMAWFVE